MSSNVIVHVTDSADGSVETEILESGRGGRVIDAGEDGGCVRHPGPAGGHATTLPEQVPR